MSSCCRNTPRPLLYRLESPDVPRSWDLAPQSKVDDQDLSKANEILDDSLCSVPPLATSLSREVKVLLSDLRGRQEQLFMQVLDQQTAFQTDMQKKLVSIESTLKANADVQKNQLVAIESTIKDNADAQKNQLVAIESTVKANADAQTLSNQHQEDLLAQFRDFAAKQHMMRRSKTSDKFHRSDSTVSANPSKTESENHGKAESTNNGTSKSIADPQMGTVSSKSSLRSVNGAQVKDRASQQDSALTKSLGNQVVYDSESANNWRFRAKRVLQSKEFEIAIALAILLNSFVMGWECQYHGLEVGFNLQFPGRPTQAHVVWAGGEAAFDGCEWLFGSMFLIEMLVKLFCWRFAYFYEVKPVSSNVQFHFKERDVKDEHHWRIPWPDWLCKFFSNVQGWNLLDCLCVSAFLFEKFAAAGFNPQMLRMLRLFRLGRLVRLLRFLESLDHLYVMTTAISGLKQVLAWAIVLLSLMLLTCDLFLVQILQATYFDQIKASDLTEEELKKHHEIYEYFGTCTRCMLSMFEITLGNWPPIARLLSEEVSEWFTLVCLAHKLTIGFAVIGVITGCILQETFKVAQTDDIIMFRQKKMAGRIMQKKMRALFEALDVDVDGKLDLTEVAAIGLLPEIKTWLSSLNIETDDLHTLFDLIDYDSDGFITMEELTARMPRIQGTARSIDVLAMQKQLWQQNYHDGSDEYAGPSENTVKSSFADFLIDLPKKINAE